MNWPILIAVGTGTFMSALDGSVANTVLPVLTRALHGSIAGAEWVVTVYLLVTSALLLSAGRWGDLHGHKPMYLAGFIVFILGSACCGLATTVSPCSSPCALCRRWGPPACFRPRPPSSP